MDKKLKIILFIILILFIFTRFAGEGFVYHQDEHRWLLLADGTEDASRSPHPPMTLTLMKFAGSVFGFFHLRILSIIFSLINLGLIYIIVKKISGYKTAVLAVFLFVFNIYSLVAGLQVDMDGGILPFFILLGYFGYIKLLKDKEKKFGLILLSLSIIGGLLTKISFILFLAALALDYFFILYERNKESIKNVVKRTLKVSIPILILMAGLYYLYASRLHTIVEYASNFEFLNFGSRAYLDLMFKVAKSFVWLSPLLTLVVAAGLFVKDIRHRQRFWYFYLAANLVLYLILFDFAKLTIERYFMFLIIPSVIIASDLIYYMHKQIDYSKIKKALIISTSLFIVFTVSLLTRAYAILPLNPKSAYVEHVKNLDFNFLIPFSSGSGPIGFYFPAAFILLAWLASLLLVVAYIYSSKLKMYIFVAFIIFGLGYNALFISEFLWGSFYGSPDRLVHKSLDYVLNDPSITKVITYNDIAPYDLKKSGKYEARFYTAPERNYEERMRVFDGHYMIVDFPEIGKPGRYWDLIQRCEQIQQFSHKRITSYILDCTEAPPII